MNAWDEVSAPVAEHDWDEVSEPHADSGLPEAQGVLGTLGTELKHNVGRGVGGYLGTIVGSALAGGEAGAGLGPWGALAGGVAGALLGGFGGGKTQEAIQGEEARRAEELQMQANRAANPISSMMGGFLADVPATFGGGGGARALGLGKEAIATAQAASKTPLTEAAIEAARISNPTGRFLDNAAARAAETSSAMAKLNAGHAGGEVSEGHEGWGDAMGDILRGAVTGAPFGLVPNFAMKIPGLPERATALLSSIGVKAPTEAAVNAVSQNLYDTFTKGEPFDLSKTLRQAAADIPGFMLMAGAGAAMHERNRPVIETAQKIEGVAPETAKALVESIPAHEARDVQELQKQGAEQAQDLAAKADEVQQKAVEEAQAQAEKVPEVELPKTPTEAIPEPAGEPEAVQPPITPEEAPPSQIEPESLQSPEAKGSVDSSANQSTEAKPQPQLNETTIQERAKSIAEHLGGTVVGSASKTGPARDIDILLKEEQIPEAIKKMEALGYERQGSQVVSPQEAKKAKKNFGSGWARNWLLKKPGGDKVELWHQDKGILVPPPTKSESHTNAPEAIPPAQPIQPAPAQEAASREPFIRSYLAKEGRDWSDEAVAAANDFLGGDTSALERLKPLQKPHTEKMLEHLINGELTPEQMVAADKAQVKAEERAAKERQRTISGKGASKESTYKGGTEQIEQEKIPAKEAEATDAVKGFNTDIEEGLRKNGFISGDVLREALMAPVNFVKWGANMVAKFGHGIKQFLSAIWNHVKGMVQAARKTSEVGGVGGDPRKVAEARARLEAAQKANEGVHTEDTKKAVQEARNALREAQGESQSTEPQTTQEDASKIESPTTVDQQSSGTQSPRGEGGEGMGRSEQGAETPRAEAPVQEAQVAQSTEKFPVSTPKEGNLETEPEPTPNPKRDAATIASSQASPETKGWWATMRKAFGLRPVSAAEKAIADPIGLKEGKLYGELTRLNKAMNEVFPRKLLGAKRNTRSDAVPVYIEARELARKNVEAGKGETDYKKILEEQAKEIEAKDPKLAEKYRVAQDLSPEESALADTLSGMLDKWGTEAVDLDLLSKDQLIRGYFPHLWEKPEGPQGAKDFSDLQGKFRRTMDAQNKRSIMNIFEGEKAGLKLRTDTQGALEEYVEGLRRAQVTNEVAKNLLEMTGPDGRRLAYINGADVTPIAKDENGQVIQQKGPKLINPNRPLLPTDKNGKPVDISDYKEISHPALREWTQTDPTHGTYIKGNIVVSPDAYKLLNNYLDRSGIRKWYEEKADSTTGAAVRATAKFADKAQREVKGAMLSGTPFHLVTEGWRALSHFVNPFTKTRFDDNNQSHLDWARDGLVMPRYEKDSNRLGEGIASSGLVHKIPGWGPLAKAIADFTWEHIGGLKIDTANKLMGRYEKSFAPELKSGEVTTEQLRKHVAREVNKLYGGEDVVRAGRNPTVQHALQLIMLAPDFTKTTLGAIGSGLKGIAGAKAYRPQGIALAGSVIALYAAARAMNRLLNDGDDKAEIAPFGIAKDNKVYTMRSLPQDMTSMVGDWRRFLSNRLSPTIGKPLLEYLGGRNYRGEEISTPEIAKEIATAPLPMFMRGLPGINQLTESTKNNPISPWDQLMSGLGIHASKHTAVQEASNVANEFRKAAGKPSVPYPASPYTPMKNALLDNDLEKGREEYLKLVSKIRSENPRLSTEEIKKKITTSTHQSIFHLWSGDDSVEEKMLRSATPEQRAKINRGEIERRNLWHKYVAATGQGGDLAAATPKPKALRS